MRKLILAALLAGAGLAGHAQPTADYPARPIKFVLISAAGSGGDTLARLLAEKMGPLLKGNFVIENRPGGGGSIAVDATAKAAPDGYTITLGGATTHVLLPASRPSLSYNAVKDFAYIGQVGTASIVLLATNDLPANNLTELLALANASPEGLQYASWGNGSTGHFCGALIQLKKQAKTTHIPYKSVAQIQTDLLGGHIKLGWVDMVSGTPMVKSGRVKAIATCPVRSPSLPGVNSIQDDGIDLGGRSMGSWGLYAPAGTPKPIVDKLAAALRSTLDMPEVKARMMELGTQAAFIPGDEYSVMTAKDIEYWKQIAQDANIRNE
jgi:tripartite-type tricarboxylate transporter receptor subunit TctC